MTTLPQTPVSILQCIRLCFKAIPTVIKNNWLNFVLLSLTSLVPSFALTGKNILGVIVYIILLLVSWYFYACFLYKANDNLTSRTATYQETFRLIFKRFHHIIAVYFILFLLVVALFSTMQLSHFITNAQARSIAAIIMALAALWLLWTLMYANTRVVLDNANAIAAFKFSFQIVKGNWIRNFLVWLAVMLVFILIGFGIVALFNLFHAKYLMIATVVILALIMPIVINSIVIVQFNDLKLRYQTKQ